MNTDYVGGSADVLDDVDTTVAADIETQPVSWLFEPYIPIGTVTILFGEGGEGKSFYSLALAAAVTRGVPLFGAASALPPSGVIIQNAENPWPFVIKPRLEMLGADCSKIYRINEADKRLTLTDSRIEAAIVKHNVKLVIIDPVQSHLPDNFSMNRAESVRPALTHLERVAERTGCAFLLVGHVNKGKGKAQHRGLGSIDIMNSVPSVLYLGRAEGFDDDVRAISHGKSNFAELGASQSFRLNKTDGFQWLDECDVTPEDILNFSASRSREDRSKIDEAADFLFTILSDDEMSAAEAIEQADELGISRKTLERARKAVGIRSKRVDGHWVWCIGEDSGEF